MDSSGADLYAAVDEAAAVARGSQVGVLLGAGDLDGPHRLPGLVQLAVDRVHPRVVGCHRVAHVSGDPVLLETGEGREREEERGKA